MVSGLKGNVVASLQLLNAHHKLRVRRVVFVFHWRDDLRMSEADFAAENSTDRSFITAHGINKLETRSTSGPISLRPRVPRACAGHPYGPLQTALKNQASSPFWYRGWCGRSRSRLGDGSVIRDFIFIDDVVDALKTVIDDRSASHIFNIDSGQTPKPARHHRSDRAGSRGKEEIAWKPKRSVDVPVSIVASNRARGDLDGSPKTSF
jgi:UDP-glucose 4-epimerase